MPFSRSHRSMHRSFFLLPGSSQHSNTHQEGLTALTTPHSALPLPIPLRYATSRIRTNAHAPFPLLAAQPHSTITTNSRILHAIIALTYSTAPARPTPETRRDETKQAPNKERRCAKWKSKDPPSSGSGSGARGLGMSESHARSPTRPPTAAPNTQVERPTSVVIWLPAYPHRMSETPTNDVRRAGQRRAAHGGRDLV